MNRRSFIEHSVTDRNQQLIVTTSELPSQWLVADLRDDSFPDHIPELLLGDPVFFAIVANY